MTMNRDRGGLKWDRAARLLRVAHGAARPPGRCHRPAARTRSGSPTDRLPRPVGDGDRRRAAHLAGKGRWGLEAASSCRRWHSPPHEATTLFLAARSLRGDRRHCPELIAASSSSAASPAQVLGEHIQSTIDAFAATPNRGRALHAGAAGADRGVGRSSDGRDRLRAGRLRPGQGLWRAACGRIDRSVRADPALYLIGFDEGRQARRTFKVERILEASADARDVRAGRRRGPRPAHARGWDVIADEPIGPSWCASRRGRAKGGGDDAGIPTAARAAADGSACSGTAVWQGRTRSASGSWAGVPTRRSWPRARCATR